ncbi:MAG: prepilin peptidase [Pseudomonadota bacterium]
MIDQLPVYMPFMFAVALSVCLLWVVVSDAVRYIIPNKVNLALLLLFVAGLFLLPVQPLSALGLALVAAALVLAVGLGLFALGLMGGGDVKLLAVLTLWTGWHMVTVQFLFMTTMAGGVLVLVVLVARFFLPPIWIKLHPGRNLPRLFTAKQPVPYGIAIAGAFAWLMWVGDIPVLR